MPDMPAITAILVARHDQALAAAIDWWNSHASTDRRNLLRLLCDPAIPVSRYRGLNDEALKILRDLAALALGRLVIGNINTEEIEL